MNTKQQIQNYLNASISDNEYRICHRAVKYISQLEKLNSVIPAEKWRNFSIRRMLGSGTLSSSKETKSWDEVNQYIHQRISTGQPPTFQDAQNINRLIHPENSGEIRKCYSVGSDTKYLHPNLINEFINNFESFLLRAVESKDSEEAIMNAFLCYSFGSTIHPFEDGNGRTFRSLADWILLQNGLLPVTFGNAVQARVAIGMNTQIPKRSDLLERYLQGLLVCPSKA
jgi:hypothetical protein